MDAKLFLLHALSPLHAGTGRGVGVIDLPIAREKATGIPYLPGSSLKGVLRDACETKDREKIFGPDTNNADDYAGAVNFTDLRVLLFPVRSLRGTFAWVTSPLLLRRLRRDAKAVSHTLLSIDVPYHAEDGSCLVANENCKIIDSTSQVILEDLPLDAERSQDVTDWANRLGKYLFPDDQYWQNALVSRFCIVSDDTMGFLLETGTEVVARIALDEKKKTVKDGALWYEESLPAESILSGIVAAVEVTKSGAKPKEVFQTVKDITKQPLQVGGSATVGRGFCQMRILDVEETKK
ncbi:MAG: type III-B CRISPR module RAMP protein Cmr4 [Anaerolinea sp. 4484_236]|nr:MAG: type III-B CRISPR module RAMP protein Cmr4 [Anaerolinea sp. 4484_236]